MTEEEPTFGQIVDILQTPAEETLFVMRMLYICYFSTHYHAYEVSLTNTVAVYTHNRFIDHHPLHILKSFNTSKSPFLAMKYHLMKSEQ